MPQSSQSGDANANPAPASSSTPLIQASPVAPPPVYALVTPGLHRCSAIGLEEVLNQAWSDIQPLVTAEREQHTTSSSSSNGSHSHDGRQRSSQSHSRKPTNADTSPRQSMSAKAGKRASLPHNGALSKAIILQSPLLSFLASLRLRTIIYLSPSLLPASLLKLSRDLNLSLLQWDLEGGRVWRVRQGADNSERDALYAFTEVGEERDEDDLVGLDLTSMTKATLETALNIHCSGVLVCDPSGLSETSLVIGCLRRMMRWNFASVCLEYRAFAPSRSPSTANHLRFVELFPLETLQFPEWQDLVPWAARALRLVQHELEGQGVGEVDSAKEDAQAQTV